MNIYRWRKILDVLRRYVLRIRHAGVYQQRLVEVAIDSEKFGRARISSVQPVRAGDDEVRRVDDDGEKSPSEIVAGCISVLE